MIDSKQSTKIADALNKVQAEFPDRWRIRRSGGPAGNNFGAMAENKKEGAFHCLDQSGAKPDCGACGACWVASKPVWFDTHATELSETTEAGRRARENNTSLYKGSFNPLECKHVLKTPSKGNKLGKKVTRKSDPWYGHRILALTLIERETCPRHCEHWLDCYGNNMPFAHRMQTEGLMQAIEADLEQRKADQKPFVVRLHVLGDFWSVEYVEFWGRMMAKYPLLKVFGYTAHRIDTSTVDRLPMVQVEELVSA
jgi:hypothetical protein